MMIQPMKNSNTYAHKIGAVSSLSGVPAPTLRIWEARYDCFTPHKTEGKHRLYSDDDVLKATLLKRLTENGHSISSVASLSCTALNDLLQKQQTANCSDVVSDTSWQTLSTRCSHDDRHEWT